MSQVITSPATRQIDASAIIAQGLGNITREQQEQVVLHDVARVFSESAHVANTPVYVNLPFASPLPVRL